MPRPHHPVVLVIDPASRLGPLLAEHPALREFHLHPVTGPPAAEFAERVINLVQELNPAAVVMDLVPPYTGMWELLVRLRQVAGQRGRRTIFTTDLAPRPRRVGQGLLSLLQIALRVGPDGAGVDEVCDAIRTLGPGAGAE